MNQPVWLQLEALEDNYAFRKGRSPNQLGWTSTAQDAAFMRKFEVGIQITH